MVYSKEDWNAALSSEVFREYMKAELRKEAQAVNENKVDEKQVLREFEEFEKSVNSSEKMRATFKALQDKFAHDPEYTAKVDPAFVQGVMRLNLSKEAQWVASDKVKEMQDALKGLADSVYTYIASQELKGREELGDILPKISLITPVIESARHIAPDGRWGPKTAKALDDIEKIVNALGIKISAPLTTGLPDGLAGRGTDEHAEDNLTVLDIYTKHLEGRDPSIKAEESESVDKEQIDALKNIVNVSYLMTYNYLKTNPDDQMAKEWSNSLKSIFEALNGITSNIFFSDLKNKLYQATSNEAYAVVPNLKQLVSMFSLAQGQIRGHVEKSKEDII